jgi:chitinase
VRYYQSWNVRERKCNKVSPKDLNTVNYTRLFYSFASIDPVMFKVVPTHSDDLAMMREFTALSKPGKLQTWIAIGGFDFSDKGTPTHTTWGDMCLNKERRGAFISSVKTYMDGYGFQGVDLDWEYPGDPERGGRKLADVRNFAQLLRDARRLRHQVWNQPDARSRLQVLLASPRLYWRCLISAGTCAGLTPKP